MALRENERRILAEIEHGLSEDDPELAGHLSSFGEDDPSFAVRYAADEWKPWLVCGAIVLVVIGLLVMLFMAIPDTTPDSESTPLGTSGIQTLAP